VNTATYPACVRELYESEILGEAFALALVEVAKGERDRYHFGTLLQLETETKARLRPFLAKHGMPLTENMDLGDVDAMVVAYKSTSSLGEFAGVIKPAVQNFLSRFEEIARIGPPDDREVLESMVRHESAILQWLAMESEGNSEGSLDSMLRELQYPLPRPGSPSRTGSFVR
jgi:hypothetical protein